MVIHEVGGVGVTPSPPDKARKTNAIKIAVHPRKRRIPMVLRLRLDMEKCQITNRNITIYK
jgi:hypothetical protein